MSNFVCRAKDFEELKRGLKFFSAYSTDSAIVAEGDSLELLRRIPDRSVSLVLTDPPYHATKKSNIRGDTDFGTDQEYLDWLQKFASEWARILKKNGSLFVFCDSSMAARIEVMLSERFNILSSVVWTKPNEPGFDGWKGKMNKQALRQWYPHSERIIFAEIAVHDNMNRSPLASMLRELRLQAGLSQHELTAAVGAFGKVNHGGAVSNWEAGRNTPSRDQYEKIRSAILATGKVKFMPPYEDAVRVFQVDSNCEFTDVWNFPSVKPYRGKHPAEKPLEMLEHAISSTTMPGDIVLDCFAGSGNTALAAIKLERRAVAMELDNHWVDHISKRLHLIAPTKQDIGHPSASAPQRETTGKLQLPLFELES